MKITQSSLQSEGASYAWQATSQQTEVSVSIDYPDSRQTALTTQPEISSAGLAAQQTDALGPPSAEDTTDPRLRLLIAIIEAMTGHKIELFNGAALQQSMDSAAQAAPAPTTTASSSPEPVWSVRVESSRIHEEMESAHYSASGAVATADGRQIQFALDLSMQRYEREESSTVFEAGNARKLKDPLVLNLGTDQVRLRAEEFSFDLNADGQKENVAQLAAGSAFLARDRNGNGKIDDGSELFGPTSGDGFNELSALDDDGNGWIDENDAAFAQLQVWRPGEESQGLLAANVGAIALAHEQTGFSLKAAGETAGQIRTTGMFLSEDGQARTMQQIDLVV